MGLQGTVNEWRKDILQSIKQSESEGIRVTKVTWSTAEDEHVCSLRAARNGKQYTIEELEKELEGEFCKPEPGDRCRCGLLIEEDDLEYDYD